MKDFEFTIKMPVDQAVAIMDAAALARQKEPGCDKYETNECLLALLRLGQQAILDKYGVSGISLDAYPTSAVQSPYSGKLVFAGQLLTEFAIGEEAPAPVQIGKQRFPPISEQEWREAQEAFGFKIQPAKIQENKDER